MASKAILEGLSQSLVAGRVPLMPIETLFNILSEPDPFAELCNVLRSQPLIRAAIQVASPSLADAIETWVSGGAVSSDGIKLKALAYVARLSTRPTPFGLCAGIGIVDVGEHTTLQLDLEARQFVFRPDMDFMMRVAKKIETGPFRSRIRYIINDAAYVAGDKLHVVNVLLSYLTRDGTQQRPVSLNNTAVVRFIRANATSLSSYAEIALRVKSAFDAEEAEVTRLLDALIEAGLLLSEFHASPVGDPISYLLRRFGEIDDSFTPVTQQLTEALRNSSALQVSADSMVHYKELTEACSTLIEDPGNSVLQVDMRTAFTGSLNTHVVGEAATLAEYHMRFGYEPTLAKYRERFVERYGGVERMVPLLELVDDNIGLGSPDNPEMKRIPNPERDSTLVLLASKALRDGSDEIELSSNQLDQIAPRMSPETLIDTAEVAFQIAASSRDAIDQGDFRIVPSGFVGTILAGRSLGRFLHLFDDRVRDAVASVRAVSSQTMDLPVEVVYAPTHSRNYNLFIRPRIIEDELRVGVVSEDPPSRVRLDDLWVGVEQQQFFLWSKSLQSRIRPIESHMFNTSFLAPSICRLLSFMIREGSPTMQSFDWGSASSFPSLPRLRFGRLIFSPRRWTFPAAELGNTSKEALESLRTFRTAWRVPRYVVVTQGDNWLPIDLDSSVSGAFLLSRFPSQHEQVVLEEMLPAPHEMWLDMPNGRYACELVAALKATSPRPKLKKQRSITLVDPRHRYGPGSNWLYVKVYIGAQVAEHFLLRTVQPLVAEFRRLGFIDRWFFLRFSDPAFHLRLRIHAAGEHRAATLSRLLEALESQLVSQQIIRYALDTYDPEYERYGGSAHIEAVERFFNDDSDVTLARLAGCGRSLDARVAAAARSFSAYATGDDTLADQVLSALATGSKIKLTQADRIALKSEPLEGLASIQPDLQAALQGTNFQEQLPSLFHMHCNRFGVIPSAEPRAAALTRSLLLAERAQRNRTTPVT